jgi:hypothetical protein
MATVSLTERLRRFEEFLCPLLIDLRHRGPHKTRYEAQDN